MANLHLQNHFYKFINCYTFNFKMMTTQQVADRMKELFDENKWDELQDELFDENCVSIEPPNTMGMAIAQGLPAIKEKGRQFNDRIIEMHGGYVSDLLVGGNFISCAMGFDATMKGTGRINMEEIAVYEVKNGKIISEQFFF